MRRLLYRCAVVALVAGAVGAATGAEAGVLLVKGKALLDNSLPPLIPLPDGAVVAANDIALRGLGVAFGGDDVLVYDIAGRRLTRYGDLSPQPLSSFGMAFAGAMMIADPATLTFTPLAAQDAPLQEVLDQPGFVVMIDVGPAILPPSALAIDADDVHTATPASTATPTVPSTALPTDMPPTATTSPGPIRTPTGTGAGTPTAPGGTATAEETAAPTATPLPVCRGDCTADGAVTVDELVLAVNIALGLRPSADCPGLDADGSHAVSIDELIVAVGNALVGCD